MKSLKSKVCGLMIAILFFPLVLLSQNDSTQVPGRMDKSRAHWQHHQKIPNEQIIMIGDSIIYPHVPVAMSMISIGDKVRHYCIVNYISVDEFAAKCTKKVGQNIPKEMIWEIIRNEKEPIGKLRIAIYDILSEKPKDRMDY